MGPEPTLASPRPRAHRRWLRVALRMFAGVGLGLAVLLVWLWLDARRDRSAWMAERIGQPGPIERQAAPGPAGCSTEAVRLCSSSGLCVDLTLLQRPWAPGQPLRPAAVILGGHRTGRDAALLVGDPGEVVVAALDYPLEGSDRIKGLGPILAALPRIRAALLDTAPAAALAVRWLASQPGVDPARIELLGVSLGAVFAPLAAGLEPAASRLWLVHGGAAPLAWLEHALERKQKSPLLSSATARLAYLLARGPNFELEPWLARLPPRELVIVAARDDARLPHELVLALLDGAPCPARLAWTEGGHVDPKKPEIVRQLIQTVLGGIAGEPPPPYRPGSGG